MPVDLEWSHRVRADLLHIYISIGLERPLAAEHWFDRLEARAEVLRHQPRMGGAVPTSARASASSSSGPS